MGYPFPIRVNCKPILQKGVTDIMLKPPFITNWWIFQAKAPYKESRPHDGGRPI